MGIPFFMATALAVVPVQAGAGAGVGNVPQGTQSDKAYADSFQANHVTNVFATTQRTSCYTPEVAYFGNLGPNDGYTGMSACPGSSTGEALGPYPSQAGSTAGFVATRHMLGEGQS